MGFDQKLKGLTHTFITLEHQVEKLKTKRDEDKSSCKKIKEKLKETEKKVDKYEIELAYLIEEYCLDLRDGFDHTKK